MGGAIAWHIGHAHHLTAVIDVERQVIKLSSEAAKVGWRAIAPRYSMREEGSTQDARGSTKTGSEIVQATSMVRPFEEAISR